MATKFFTWHKAPINSFELREAQMGIIKQGRYRGFDKFSLDTSNNELDLIIEHESGLPKVDKNGNLIYNFGVFVMPFGTIVHEEEKVQVTISNNNSGTLRIDLLVAEFEWDNNDSTLPTINYHLIEGISASWSELNPPLTNKATQVPLVKIFVKNNASAMGDITTEPISPPVPAEWISSDYATYLYHIAGKNIANETAWGVIKTASQNDVNNGIGDNAVTPSKLQNRYATTTRTGLASLATQQEVNLGNNSNKIVTPITLKNRLNNELSDLSSYQEIPTIPSLNTGWYEPIDGSETIRYWKDSLGIVHIEGLAVGSENNLSSRLIFTLPSGYIPSKTRYFPVINWFDGKKFIIQCEILTNGDVVLQEPKLPFWVDNGWVLVSIRFNKVAIEISFRP